jgi:hypothetical protein
MDKFVHMKKLVVLFLGAICGLGFGTLVYDFSLHYLADQQSLKANQHQVVIANTTDSAQKKNGRNCNV